MENINVVIVKDYFAMSQYAANQIIELVNKQKGKKVVLGLATGNTPIGMYQELVKNYRDEKVSFLDVVSFNLDEYYPIDASHSLSFTSFMKHYFFDHVDIQMENVFIPLVERDSTEKEIQAFCQAYEKKIKTYGGIDLQILGIGSNGHIGFNEPGTPFYSRTHLVKLTDETIQANGLRENGLEVNQAITVGIETIMESKKILLLASGQDKTKIMKQFFERNVTVNLPASILKKHSNVTIVIDKGALGAQKINLLHPSVPKQQS